MQSEICVRSLDKGMDYDNLGIIMVISVLKYML